MSFLSDIDPEYSDQIKVSTKSKEKDNNLSYISELSPLLVQKKKPLNKNTLRKLLEKVDKNDSKKSLILGKRVQASQNIQSQDLDTVQITQSKFKLKLSLKKRDIKANSKHTQTEIEQSTLITEMANSDRLDQIKENIKKEFDERLQKKTTEIDDIYDVLESLLKRRMANKNAKKEKQNISSCDTTSYLSQDSQKETKFINEQGNSTDDLSKIINSSHDSLQLHDCQQSKYPKQRNQFSKDPNIYKHEHDKSSEELSQIVKSMHDSKHLRNITKDQLLFIVDKDLLKSQESMSIHQRCEFFRNSKELQTAMYVSKFKGCSFVFSKYTLKKIYSFFGIKKFYDDQIVVQHSGQTQKLNSKNDEILSVEAKNDKNQMKSITTFKCIHDGCSKTYSELPRLSSSSDEPATQMNEDSKSIKPSEFPPKQEKFIVTSQSDCKRCQKPNLRVGNHRVAHTCDRDKIYQRFQPITRIMQHTVIYKPNTRYIRCKICQLEMTFNSFKRHFDRWHTIDFPSEDFMQNFTETYFLKDTSLTTE